MEVEALQEFAHRRWDLVERFKAEFWAAEKRAMTPHEALRLADALRRCAASMRPGWPSEEERLDDLRSHQEVARKLRLVRSHSHR